MKQTTKLKINAILTMITIMTMSNADAGIMKIVCWAGLLIEMIVFAKLFEKDIR